MEYDIHMQYVLCTVYFNSLLICQTGYASTGTQKSTKANVPVRGLGTANIPNNVIALYFYFPVYVVITLNLDSGKVCHKSQRPKMSIPGRSGFGSEEI